MAAILVDTNILVYAHDRGERVKQAQAIRVLDRLQGTGGGHLSAQCLSEFFSVATRGARPLLTVDDAASQVERLARSWPVLAVTPLIVLEALRGVRERRMAYWDAQLWATARLNQVPILFSEDFNAGATVDGVRFVNPFAVDFELDDWG